MWVQYLWFFGSVLLLSHPLYLFSDILWLPQRYFAVILEACLISFHFYWLYIVLGWLIHHFSIHLGWWPNLFFNFDIFIIVSVYPHVKHLLNILDQKCWYSSSVFLSYKFSRYTFFILFKVFKIFQVYLNFFSYITGYVNKIFLYEIIFYFLSCVLNFIFFCFYFCCCDKMTNYFIVSSF